MFFTLIAAFVWILLILGVSVVAAILGLVVGYILFRNDPNKKTKMIMSSAFAGGVILVCAVCYSIASVVSVVMGLGPETLYWLLPSAVIVPALICIICFRFIWKFLLNIIGSR